MKKLNKEEIKKVNAGCTSNGADNPNHRIIDHGIVSRGEPANKLPEGYDENGVRVS